MSFFCINCKANIEPDYKACPFCGEPITDFLRKHLEEPIELHRADDTAAADDASRSSYR